MKFKRKTALLLAGALALSTVPMNVFAQEVEVKETRATAVTTSGTAVEKARFVITPEVVRPITVDEKEGVELGKDVDYAYLSIEVKNEGVEAEKLTKDVKYQVTLSNGKWVSSYPTLAKGITFERKSDTEGVFTIATGTDLSETKDTTTFVLPIAATTTSKNKAMTLKAVGNEPGGNYTTANLSSTAVTKFRDDASEDLVTISESTGRNEITPTIKITEEIAGDFVKGSESDYVRIKFNTGDLPSESSKDNDKFYSPDELKAAGFQVKGFGLTYGTNVDDVYQEFPENFVERYSDTELRVYVGRSDAFETTDSTDFPGTLSVKVPLGKSSSYGEVKASVTWAKNDVKSSSEVAGSFSDYDYTLYTTEDTDDDDFEYPQLRLNGRYSSTEGNEDNYEVLEFTLEDSIFQSILWENRDFDLVFSDNVSVKKVEVEAEDFQTDKNLEDVGTSSASTWERDGNVLHYHSNTENEPADDDAASVTFRVWVSPTSDEPGDVTVQATGKGVPEDSKVVKLAELVKTVQVETSVTTLASVAGPQPTAPIYINELVSGELGQDDVFVIRMEFPSYIVSATSTVGFYGDPTVTSVGDGKFDGDAIIMDDDALEEKYLNFSNDVSDVYTSQKTASGSSITVEDAYGLKAGDIVVKVEANDETDGDELASIKIDDINVVLGTLFTVPSTLLDVKVFSFDPNEYYAENDDDAYDYDSVLANGVSKDYLQLNASTSTGGYADYELGYNDNYNNAIEMTIDQFTFNAVDPEGEAFVGQYHHANVDPALYSPKLVNNDTYVSIRSFANAIGGDVEWDSLKKRVLIYPQGIEAYAAGKGARAVVSQEVPNMVTFEEPGKNAVELMITNQVGEEVLMLNFEDVNFLPLRFFAEKIYKVESIDTTDFNATKTFTIYTK
ncbi:MAG: stalk domain-containing protein [Lachnospirales bacterium]